MSRTDDLGHAVVLGDSRFATTIAVQQAVRSPVVHAGLEPLPEVSERISEVPLVRNPEALLRSVGAAGARLLVVDLSEDSATLSVVAVMAGFVERPEIVANVRDPSLRRVVDGQPACLGECRRDRAS